MPNLHTDDGLVHAVDLPPGGVSTLEWRAEESRPAYVRVRRAGPTGGWRL
jgi:hypothetical protein